ncbi:unnamed protein product [Effrenium voratum]|uniref:Diphthine--ammonia ligase n=1 Tax=Effrenium voratum TaxID=2562239 RepID=A0AA36N6X3_9DINO|nr:unnamed protein product [Effrenium voratum]
MRVLGLISGGKDSIWNLHYCHHFGHELRCLANLAPPPGVSELDSYMYQTVGSELVTCIAEAMGLPLVRRAIAGAPKNVECGTYAPEEGDEVQRIRTCDLADLDVKEDCVTFLVKSERVLVELAPKTINTNDCSARFRKKDLVITWRDTEPKLQEPKLPEPKLPESPAPTELPEDESKVEFGLSAAVSWACGRLAVLKIPEESTGFQRFKAEVGLAELAFYGLRCGRLGLPAPLWPRLFAAEARLEAALQAAAAGDFGDTGEAIGFVLETLNRVAGAVCDVRLEVPEQPLLGVAETTQVSAGLAGSRWALRDGTLLGPGIGTWKLSPEQAEESVMAALREGVRHVDTAAEYGTEAAVARGIRNAGVARGDVFVNLKVAADSANELREVVASSMAKWGCGSVDCLMLHRPPPNDDELESVWRVLEEEVKAGRARMLGASNVTVQQLEVLSSTKRPESLWPAVVQLKCSMFHQGGYFIENSARLWQLLRQKRIIPVGISLFNSLHSCVSPLEEPMTHAWAAQLGSTSAELLATWARLLGVCPLLRCSPSHAPSFRTELHVSPQKAPGAASLVEGGFRLGDQRQIKASLRGP